MNNNKDFSEQIDNLFEGLSLDEAGDLIDNTIKPSEKDLQENNNVEVDKDLNKEVKPVAKNIDKKLNLVENLIKKKRKEVVEDTREVVEPVKNTDEPLAEVISEAERILSKKVDVTEEDTNYIFDLSDQLSDFVKKPKNQIVTNDDVREATLESKIESIQAQIGILRGALMESGNNLVSGIGQGGDGQLPGSGEVRLQKMDDVDMDGIKPGQTVCWDPDLNSGTGGWYPCDGGGGSGGGGGTIQPPINGSVFGCKRVKDCADLYWGSKLDFETWYNGGTLDGDLGTAVLVQADVKTVSGALALDYTPVGIAEYQSDAWYAVGVVDCLDNIIDPEDISTPGISSPFDGPEGYFLVYDNPDDCAEGQQGCEALPIDFFGCSPVLEADYDSADNPDGFTNELRYGTEADYEADPQGGDQVLDVDGNPIVGVTEIFAVTFVGCDRDTMIGKYNVYYRIDGGIKIASYYDDDPDADTRSFFIADAECDTTVEPEPEQPVLIGCLAAEGCKEVSDKDADGNENKYGQLYFGNGVAADSEMVTVDIGGNPQPVDDVQKLQFVTTKEGETYEVDDVTGEITATWVVYYQSFDPDPTGVPSKVEWEGTIDPTTCEIGFFIDSPNACLNPAEEIEEEGDTKPWPGIITGCGELADGSSSAKLYWGDGTVSNSSPAKTGPGNTGVEIDDAVKIIYVFSTDPNVDETNKVGTWNCLYQRVDDSYGLAYSPNSNINDGSTEGFFLDTENGATCADGGEELPELKFGIFTGCREKSTGSPVYWNTRVQAELGATDNPAVDVNGLSIDNALRLYRPFSLDNKTYFSIVVVDNALLPNVAIHYDDGTTSPIYGFYLGGPDVCLEDTEDWTCPLEEIEYVPPVGCRITDEGTNLLFGPISLIDNDFAGVTPDNIVDDSVIKILQIYTDDKCDNNYGKWHCLYVRYDVTRAVEEVKLATREGIYLAEVYEDSETFFLDTTDVPCADDPDSIEGGKPVAGLITGCRRTQEVNGTTLHWGAGTDTSEIVKDVDGVDVTDAKFILGVVSFNSDDTKWGYWICLFRRANGTYSTAITYGQSPTDGYYLNPVNCDPDECEGDIYFGYLPDCNEADPNFGPGELYWNNGDDSVPNLSVVDGNGDQILARKVLSTFTTNECDPDFDITDDVEWLALYFDQNGKLSLTGTQLGKSPLGGYYLEVDEVNSFCAYNNGPGLGCDDEHPCPIGFECVGGICEQLRCDSTPDCPEGFDCVNGVCLKPCGEGGDALCPPGSHCQQIGPDDLTYCIPGPNCNGDCPEGYFCLNGECVILECPLNSFDDPTATNCPPGYDCHLGLCLKPCPGGDSECPPGFFCTDGHCFPINGPCPPEGCPPGYDCVLGACRPNCDTTTCPPGFECFNGHCFPGGTSCPPEGCPEGSRCIELPGGNFVCLPTFHGCDDQNTCGGNFECINGICLPPCDPVEGCPEGFACYLGVCVPVCDPDTPCPPGFNCFGGICVPEIGCDPLNDTCPAGTICIDGICRPGCDPADCPEGFGCFLGVCYPLCDTIPCPPGHNCIEIENGDNICIPEIGCGVDGECPDGFSCVNGICRPDCTLLPDSCPPGFTCFEDNSGTHCYPSCENTTCPPGYECIGGICLPPFVCDDDTTCPPGWNCTPEGICRPPCDPGDGSDQCPGLGLECIDGHCWHSCNNTDCPPGFYCVGGKCIPEIQCDDNRPCPTGFECINGICREICTGSCPDGFVCWNGHCLPECGFGVGDCPPGYECREITPGVSICVPIVGCGGTSDCPSGYVCFNGICVPECNGGNCPDGADCFDGVHCLFNCTEQSDCPPGFICWNGVCYPSLNCDPDNPCPPGYECLNGTCVESCTHSDGSSQDTCPEGHVCTDDDVCLKVCSDTNDCPPGTLCIDGVCVPIFNCNRPGGCPNGFDCIDGICLPSCTPSDGSSQDDCPVGSICTPEGVCMETCDPDNDTCPLGFICVDGLCQPIGGPDRPCSDDNHCPDGFECIDGFCRRVCAAPDECPPGYICFEGHCVPGIPEGPCADGVCPPGYECFMGICREPCDYTDPNNPVCPPGFECIDIPGGCWPQVCDPDTPCPSGFYCLDGRCRQICDGDPNAQPCPDGYDCVEIMPGLSVCLPITIDPDGPEQPTDPGPIEHPKVGCEEVDKCGYLYWGTEEDYANNSGELQQNANGPIEVKKIELVVATNVYPNGFGTYTVYYRECNSDDIKLHSIQALGYEGDLVKSFYIKPDDDSICINFGETHDPIQGLIAGCKETDNGGTIHWGTIPESIDDNIPNDPLTYEDGTVIIAKGIMSVFSIDSVDPEDGNVGQIGNWNIVYQTMSGQIEFIRKYGRSGPQGPEGAFMRASSGSVCIDNAFDLVTTRDVILVNSPRVMQTRSRFFGDGPQGTNDIVGPNDGELIRYETQEQANILNLDILDLLDQRKPTVHVIPDINDVRGHYVAQRGDLWIDPTDYSIYVCDISGNPSDQDILDDPQRYLRWIELGAASSGGDSIGSGGSNIFLQDAEPSQALVKHGDIWIDAETYLMYTFEGTNAMGWVSLTGDIKAVLDNRFEVHIDENPPPKSTTKSGDLWFDSEVAEMRVAYIPSGSNDFVWVPVQGTGHKSVPQDPNLPFSDDELDDEIRSMRSEMERLSTRLTALETQQRYNEAYDL